MKLRILPLIGLAVVTVWLVSALVSAGEWSRAHWAILALCAATMGVLVTVLYFRFKHAQLREEASQKAVGEGPMYQFARVFPLQPWPKRCRLCSVPVWDWHSASVHFIACYGADIETPEAPREVPWHAEQVGDSGAVDTFVDGPQNGTDREAVES